jgi:uncharacterized protein YsxB (DUF464 family)
MINIRIDRTGNLITGFRVEGHSGFDDSGKDIVCAGVSITAQNAINGLEELAGLKNFYRMDKNGIIECRIPEDAGRDAGTAEAVQTILRLTEIGFREIMKVYGKYVAIRNKEV